MLKILTVQLDNNIFLKVRQRAEEIDLSSLNSENFQSLLSELFHDGGITQVTVIYHFTKHGKVMIKGGGASRISYIFGLKIFNSVFFYT